MLSISYTALPTMKASPTWTAKFVCPVAGSTDVSAAPVKLTTFELFVTEAIPAT
ncbi:MAG: hypothetical protein KDA41_21385 [Planctomycetales bacterium]|nr:hypothetical protein [Planctomycetales bacterium]